MNHADINPNGAIKRIRRTIDLLENQWNKTSNPIESSRLHNQIKGAIKALDILKDEIEAQKQRPAPPIDNKNWLGSVEHFENQSI